MEVSRKCGRRRVGRQAEELMKSSNWEDMINLDTWRIKLVGVNTHKKTKVKLPQNLT